jgi:hypothetical protein
MSRSFTGCIQRRCASPDVFTVSSLNFLTKDEWIHYVHGGDRSLLPVKFESELRATSVGGRIQVASIGDAVQDIVGVALWFPPGTDLDYKSVSTKILLLPKSNKRAGFQRETAGCRR